jgi:hypothetical protein
MAIETMTCPACKQNTPAVEEVVASVYEDIALKAYCPSTPLDREAPLETAERSTGGPGFSEVWREPVAVQLRMTFGVRPLNLLF